MEIWPKLLFLSPIFLRNGGWHVPGIDVKTAKEVEFWKFFLDIAVESATLSKRLLM
jgi:hypothetical protein